MSALKIFYLLAVITGVGIAFFGWKMTSRNAYESAEYTVLKSDGSFELRNYPQLTLVTTPMKPDSQGGDGSFGRLFRYISGENHSNSRIAMTTPVFMESEKNSATGQMGFVIPQKVASTGTPAPAGSGVTLSQRPGGRYAVIRFAGRSSESVRAKNEKLLRDWMKRNGLAGKATAEFAGNDPPWTPGPFRRNEVLIHID